MRGTLGLDPRWGLTGVRVAMGLVLMTAGVEKLGEGLGVIAGRFAAWGVPSPAVTAPLVAGLETVGGALLLLGVGTRWLGLLFAGEFLVAAVWVKYRLFGWDFGRVDLMLLASGLLLFLNGGGRAAVDHR